LGKVIDNAAAKLRAGPSAPLLQALQHRREFHDFGIALQAVLQLPALYVQDR
jgi:hypothetical protein